MGQALLVGMDLAAVSRLADEIDKENLDVRIILVAKFDEYAEARTVLASPSFDQLRPNFRYRAFGSLLRMMGDEGETPGLLLMKMDDPFVVALRDTLGTVESKRGMHISSQSFGNRYVEDGYLFRVR